MTRKRSPTPYLFLLPALLVLGVFVIYPIIAVIYYSFTDYDIVRPPVWIGTENYRHLIEDPTFWLALTSSLVFSVKLGWFSSTGQLDPGYPKPPTVTGLLLVDSLLDEDPFTFQMALHHILLPSLVLAAYTVGLITRFTRASVLEVLGNDYVRAAHAKGLPRRTVVLRHVLRPAMVPIITASAQWSATS